MGIPICRRASLGPGTLLPAASALFSHTDPLCELGLCPSFLRFAFTPERICLAHSFCLAACGRLVNAAQRQMARKANGYPGGESMEGNLTMRDQALLERIAWHREQQRMKDEERAERARRHWRAAFRIGGGDDDGG